MQGAQAITEVLDEATRALILLDLNKLEHLERRVAEIAASATISRSGDLDTILAKKRLFELIQQNCRTNLNTLHRLHDRNTGDSWAH